MELRFQVMLGFFGPIANLVPHLGPQAWSQAAKPEFF